VSARTVTLAAGDYTLVCPIGAHESLGMTAALHVAP
jgi:uncharacterized cupredoxin-like copper-binding protein